RLPRGDHLCAEPQRPLPGLSETVQGADAPCAAAAESGCAAGRDGPSLRRTSSTGGTRFLVPPVDQLWGSGTSRRSTPRGGAVRIVDPLRWRGTGRRSTPGEWYGSSNNQWGQRRCRSARRRVAVLAQVVLGEDR